MSVFRTALWVLVIASLSFGQNPAKVPKRLIADYGFWSRTQTPPYSSAQIPFEKLTHINHASVGFGAKGELQIPAGFLEPELLTKAHAAGVKVILLLGGDFNALETDTSALPNLINGLTSFISKYKYDGVDIDWEYPSSAEDRKTYLSLFQELRKAFPSPRYLLSADVPPWGGAGYDFKQVTPLLDFWNIMTYDCAGPWTDDGQLNSPIFPDPHNPEPYECVDNPVSQAIDNFLDQLHVPAEKLNIGTPFYGYYYENVNKLYGACTNCQNTVASVNYGTWVKPRIDAHGWMTFYDAHSLVPYLLRDNGKPGFVTYDDPSSTYYRVWYSVWQRGLGGSFMWALDEDYDGHSQDLLDAMYAATIAK